MEKGVLKQMDTQLYFGNHIDAYQEDMLRDLARLIAIPSVCGKPEGKYPSGKKSAEALELILSMAQEMGFDTVNADYYAGHAEYGEGEEIACAIMDFEYMGGSMGSVVGEKIALLIEQAIAKRLPVVVFTASGGARMQESVLSLMQMAKTSCAVAKMNEEKLLYITVLTEPTFGGVTASFGTLGDIIIAEQGARIGFAGKRVIEQTIKQKLPAGFQTAEYLMKFGQIDILSHRKDLKDTISKLLKLHKKAGL